MRIIIEIEGIEVTVKAEQAGAAAVQVPVAQIMSPDLAPSQALIAATAAGAINAGPAPDVAQPPGVPPLPLSVTDLAAPFAGASDLSAGEAAPRARQGG